MPSETLFYAKLKLSIPEEVRMNEVQDALKESPDQLVVDIDFRRQKYI